MPVVCALDIETTGLNQKTDLITVICLKLYDTARCSVVRVDNLNLCLAREEPGNEESDMKLYVRTILNGCDKILAYNGRAFDIPFLCYWVDSSDTFLVSKWVEKTIDFLHEANVRIHQYISMAKAASDNQLAITKIATGLQAIEWAQKRQWQLLIEYCSADVDVLIKLFEQALQTQGLTIIPKKNKTDIQARPPIKIYVSSDLKISSEPLLNDLTEDNSKKNEMIMSADDIDDIFG